MIDKEALQLLLYAQKFYPKEYANFTNALEINAIPWDITNDRFVAMLEGFKAQFSSFLSSLESPVDKTAIETTVPTKDVLDPLVEELEQANLAKKGGGVFQNNRKKVETFIKDIKKSYPKEPIKTDAQTIIEDVAPKLIQATEFFSKQTDLPINTKGLPEIPKGFFTIIAQTPLQKIISGIVDVLPESARAEIIQSAIGKAYQTIKEKTDSLGTAVAGSEEVKRVIAQMNASSFQQVGTRLTPNNALYSFFSDAYTSVFIGPQLTEIWYAAYRHTPIQSSWSQMSAITLSLSGATTSGVARFALRETGEKIITSSFGKSLGAWIGGFFGPGIGNVVGWFVGDLIIDKGLKLIGGAVSGLFNLFSLKFITDLFSGNVESTPIWKDALFLIPLALVAVVALMAGVVPNVPILEDLFPNAQKYIMTVDNAYIQGMGGGPAGQPGQSGNNAGAGFSCTWSGPTPPTTSISVCPVHARITQGPFVPNPNESHANTDAYDFGSSFGTPIVAAHDGFVVSFVNSYLPGEYQYRSFGNNVVLIGTDAGDNVFCTNYAHLLDVSSDIISAHTNQTIIHAGQQIGVSDTTGYTYGGTGEHLHFGYKGSGSLSLPTGCP